MRITSINRAHNFGAGIDMHVHKGSWWVELTPEQAAREPQDKLKYVGSDARIMRTYNSDFFETANASLAEADKIDKMIVSNLDCMIEEHPYQPVQGAPSGQKVLLKNELDGNLELLRNSTNPNEFLYATGQPGYGNAENLRRVIETDPQKFVGIKLHPACLDVAANSSSYEPYLQLAQEKKLPCLFHTSARVDWKDGVGTLVQDTARWSKADPRLVYELAKKFPDVPVILGHLGANGEPAYKVAMDVMRESFEKKDANLFCDISWVDYVNDMPGEKQPNVIKLIKMCKEHDALERIMFGSDMPVGPLGIEKAESLGTTPSEVYKLTVERLKNAIRADEELKPQAEEIINAIFEGNAKKLFFGKSTAPAQSAAADAIKKAPRSKGRIALLSLAGAAIIGFAGYLFFNDNDDKAAPETNKK